MSRPVNVQDSIVAYPSGIASEHSYASISGETQAYGSSSNTQYATINLTTGTNATTYIYYTFNFSEIPVGATINSVTCTAKVYINTTNSSRISARQAQLYTGTTAKGSAYTVSNSTTAFTITPGTWTRAELQNARIRIYAQRGSSNTTTNYYFRFYGATFTVNYSISGTEYSITSSSSVSGYEVSPDSQYIFQGRTGTVTINGANVEDIKVTDNGNDVTSSLVRHNATSGDQTFTGIPVSFDTINSVYDTTGGDSGNGIYSTNYIENGLTDHNSTTRCALYSRTGSGTVSKMYYNFDCSSIPANATISSVSCQFKGGSQGSSYYSSYVAYLCSGTTNKTSSVSVSGSNSSPTTVTISGGSWTRADLNNIKILFQVTRGSSNTTTESTWSFFGATLTVTYTVPQVNPYYWTYDISNIAADHVVLIEQAGAYIPPEEDPQYTYYSLTLSSINATTEPGQGTTRVVAGSNQTITITPSDPQLTLALDNGVDITSQLVGGTPTNTYTVTTKVTGASYGFNLNNNTGYYVSTNNGVSKSASVARLNLDFESSCLVTIQYINYAEANYDYGMFGKLDTTVATDGLTASSSSSSPSDSTSNYQLAMCSNSSSAQTITYTVPAGQHYIDVKYGKDDASDSNNDSLQWKVLSVEATSAGGDYTYTLNNIQTNHSLIFVFGNVTYYFVTSTGTNCRLFPEGQQVKLSNDSYIINIVPTNVTDIITLYDNNIDQTASLTRLETVKSGVTSVSYQYKINSVTAAHNLTVIGASQITNKIFLKENGTWVQYSKVYVKENGVWVEKTDLSSVFSSNIKYVRKTV